MEPKRLSIQPISLKGELKDFTYIAPVVPASSSFFISFGLSLLESLIRLKCCSELEIETWDCITSLFPLIQDISKKFQLDSVYDVFIHFFSGIQSSSRKLSMEMMNEIVNSDKIMVIDLGFRMLVACITNNYLILRASARNYDVILNSLVKRLKISVFLINNSKSKVYKDADGVPVVCLYCNNSHFAVLYHRATKYVDEKPDPVYFDPNKFPFANSKMPVMESDAKNTPVIELINFLALQIPFLNQFQKVQLQNRLKNLCEENNSITLLPSINSLLEDSPCSHNSGNAMGTCGKTHCSECLKSSTKCSCGISSFTPTLIQSKNRIRSVSTNRRPRDVEKAMCLDCRKPFENNSFNLIQCKTHNICYRCRAKKLIKGKQNCPTCNREYTTEEKHFLFAVSNNFNN